MTTELYYIASIKHTIRDHEHITWWGKDHCGYTPVVGPNIGEYTLAEAVKLNDGFDCLAVPIDAVQGALSPTPYFRPGNPARFYDQPGPVVENSRANWNRLIEAALPGRIYKPKPEVFRGKRRAFALPAAAEATNG